MRIFKLKMKDLFSSQSHLYQKARPSYPQNVIDEILKHVPEQTRAWDCGAGSGQFTKLLSPYFQEIIASDLSEQQISQAPQLPNVQYLVQPAEQNDFESSSFDLITVAQAIHWFNFDAFYAEVKRVLKPNGLFSIVGYGLIQAENEALQQEIQHLYFEILNGYWDAERRYVDEAYSTIPFPFEEIETPRFTMEYSWSAVQLLDYFGTWSALKHYQKQNIDDPLAEMKQLFAQSDAVYKVQFPILLRMGR